MSYDFDVVELGVPDNPTEGEVAPDFTRPLVTDEYWEDVSLSELAEPVLLVFHPMVGGFPATYLWNELRERGLPTEISAVGVSISTPYAHKRFIREHDLEETGVRFFSDPAAAVAERYGIAHDLDGMAGITEHRPAAFVLGESRTVRYAWAAREWPAFPDYDELEAALDRTLEE